MPPRAAQLPPAVPSAPEAIEGLIGDVAAAAAAVLGQALQELDQDGGITAATRRTGGELVAMLHKLNGTRFELEAAERAVNWLQCCTS